VTTLAWSLIVLLAQSAGLGDGGSLAGLKAAYEQALSRAREARLAGQAEEADQRYLEAWQKAHQAYLGKAFGTKPYRFPVGDVSRGDFRQQEIELPAGEEIPVGVAEEAIRAADELDRPETVLAWLPRLSILFGTSSAPDPGELSGQASKLLEELAGRALQEGRLEAEAAYRSRLDQARARREAEWAAAAAEEDRDRWLGLAILAGCLLPVWFFEARFALRSRKERLLLGHEQWNDGAVLHSARVLARDPEGRPRVFATTPGDVIGRAITTLLLQGMALGAAVAGVIFLDLAWDHAGDTGTSIILGLVWLFFAFAGLMVMFGAASPSATVRRRVDLSPDGVVVRSRSGLLLRRSWTDLFPWDQVRDARIQRHEQQVKHAKIVTHLVILDAGDRSVVLGGQPERRLDQALELVESVRAHLPKGF